MQKVAKLARSELIGVVVEVIGSANKAYIGLKGSVIDETKHLLVIETSKGRKKVLKKTSIFQISYLGEKISINGELLFGSPEDRIKIKVKNENRM